MKITRYTNLALFKSKDAPSEANQKLPYFEMTAKVKDTDTKIYPAKFWYKQSESGLNYFSGNMAEPRTYEGKEYDGYVIVSIKELDALEAKVNEIPSVQTGGFTGEVASIDDIPF